MTLKRIIFAMVAVFLSFTHAMAEEIKTKLDPENTLYLDLKQGRVVIELFPEIAPKHVAHIKELIREGFYDGLTFHRVIPGFMAQGGDPLGNGTGGSDKPDLPAEFSDIPHERGILSMARGGHSINSANSQFFIVLEDSEFLDGKYTVWGRVVEGMNYVDRIKKGTESNNGAIKGTPDKIVKIQVAADADAADDEGDAKPKAKTKTKAKPKK